MVTPITPTDFGATAGLLRSEMRGGGHTTVDALRADHTRPHWVGLVQRTDESIHARKLLRQRFKCGAI